MYCIGRQQRNIDQSKVQGLVGSEGHQTCATNSLGCGSLVATWAPHCQGGVHERIRIRNKEHAARGEPQSRAGLGVMSLDIGKAAQSQQTVECTGAMYWGMYQQHDR